MKYPLALLPILALAACDDGLQRDGFLREVPPEVAAIAGPNQNLQAVKFLEEDNCFWYEHVGPVETTLLPLRSNRGRPICAAPPAEPETPAS
ncbi:MAG: hypothetical protein AAFU41_00490 [Pseudomonadota bacterium]